MIYKIVLISLTSFENDFELSHQLTEKTKLNFEINPTVNFENNLRHF